MLEDFAIFYTQTSLLYGAAHVFCFWACHAWFHDIKDPESRWRRADLIFSQFYFPVLTYFAFAGNATLGDTVESRFSGTNNYCYHYMMLYVWKQLIHIPITYWSGGKKAHMIQMMCHHALSIFCYGSALLYGTMHYYALLDGYCEVTTVFLSQLQLVKEWKMEKTWPILHIFLGIMLWITFVIFRMCLFTFWLYSFFMDSWQHPVLFSALPMSLKLAYPATTIFLLALSTMWMVPITKGIIKAAKGLMGGSGKKKD